MIIPLNTILKDRYVVVRLIAQGGMGAVYQATDRQNKTSVAIKQSLVTDAELTRAFERESRLLTRLRHASLPVVSDFFADSSGQFLVMQFVPGEDLGTLLERKGKKLLTANVMSWIIRWADQLLDALHYLHTQPSPIIHRDIKPQNLKPTPRGEIVLLDFGLAKGAGNLTVHSTVRSVRGYTPNYAPLEQIQGTGTDERSDLYALGATLYHLMTGETPPDSLTRAAAILSEQADPLRSAHELNPLVLPSIADILHQSMELEMSHRFATANAMRTALRMAASQKKDSTTGAKKTPPAAQPESMGRPQPGFSTSSKGSSGKKTIIAGPTAAPSVGPTTGLAVGPTAKMIGVPTQEMVDLSQSAEQHNNQPASTSLVDLPYQIFVVDQHGKGHFKTIGEAIHHANEGSHIIVRPGTYQENLLIDKLVEISGDGPMDKIVLETSSCSCIQMQTDYAVVRGLSIRRRAASKEQPTFAIDIPQGRLVLEACDISSETLGCIAIHGASANPLLWRCKIHSGKGFGISVFEYGRGIVEECEIFGHKLAGIRMTQGSKPIVRRCTIHHGKQDGIYVSEKAAGTIEECDIFENLQSGIQVKQEGNPFIRNCKIHNQTKGSGIYVHEKGLGIVEECDISSNAQTGIRITQDGNPLVRRCTIHDENDTGIIIVEHGRGTIESCDISNSTRMGIGIGQEGNPTIRQCRIHNGKEVGILVWESGIGRIEGCIIAHNAQAGIEIRERSNPMVYQCTINHNRMMAIMVHKDGAGIVEECDLTGNNRAWYVEDGCMVMANANRE